MLVYTTIIIGVPNLTNTYIDGTMIILWKELTSVRSTMAAVNISVHQLPTVDNAAVEPDTDWTSTTSRA